MRPVVSYAFAASALQIAWVCAWAVPQIDLDVGTFLPHHLQHLSLLIP